jgi:hypothetical protein
MPQNPSGWLQAWAAIAAVALTGTIAYVIPPLGSKQLAVSNPSSVNDTPAQPPAARVGRSTARMSGSISATGNGVIMNGQIGGQTASNINNGPVTNNTNNQTTSVGSVNSYGQKGGTTAANVNVYQSPSSQ